jgi:hypothetical protein
MPPDGHVPINVDDAIFIQAKRMCIGVNATCVDILQRRLVSKML